LGTHLPSPKGAQSPNFCPKSVVAKWLNGLPQDVTGSIEHKFAWAEAYLGIYFRTRG